MNSVVSVASLATATAISSPAISASPIAPGLDIECSNADLKRRFEKMYERWLRQMLSDKAEEHVLHQEIVKRTGHSYASAQDPNADDVYWKVRGEVIDERRATLPAGFDEDKVWRELLELMWNIADEAFASKPMTLGDSVLQARCTALQHNDWWCCECRELDRAKTLIALTLENICAMAGADLFPGAADLIVRRFGTSGDLLATTDAPSLAPSNPDAHLLALGMEFDKVREANKKNERRRKRRYNKYARLEQPLPEACRWRPSDADIGFDTEPNFGCRKGEYMRSEVDKLRTLPDEIENETFVEVSVPGMSRAFGFKTEKVRANKTRAAEIVKAFDEWIANDKELKTRLDIRDAEDDPETMRLWESEWAIEREISKTPAHTMDGLRVKARVALAMDEIVVDDEGNDCECVLGRLAENVMVLTEQRLA